MVSFEDYDRLVGLVYEAALDGARWRPFVEQLGRAAGAAVVGLEAHDFVGRAHLGAINTHAREFADSYGAHYSAINPWIPAYAEMPIGTAQRPDAYYPQEALLRTEFYNDWLLPQGIVSSAGIVLYRDEHRFLGLAINFDDRRDEHLGPAMVRLLDRLAPHLRRAFDFIRQVPEGVDAMFEDSLEALPAATLLLDRHGRLARANAPAEALLGSRRALRLGAGRRLVFTDAVAQARLESVLDSVRRGHGDGAGASFAVRRSDGAAPLRANVAPLRPASSFDAPPFSILTDNLPAVILAISEPPPLGNFAILAEYYGLSPAERRIARALCDGSTLQDYADARGISIHTARNQLKSLMSKAGVARQSQLVALFAGALPTTR